MAAVICTFLLATLGDTARKRSAFELILDPQRCEIRDGWMEVPCTVANRSGRPAVFVVPEFHFEGRVQYSLEPADRPPRFHRLVFRHGCAGIHPFREADFTEIAPGTSREIGRLRIYVGTTAAGRYRLEARYVFQRPRHVDPQYFPDEKVRNLFDRTLETTGVPSAPVEISLPR